WPLLIVATAGGIICGGVFFFVGPRHHPGIFRLPPPSRYSPLIARSGAVFFPPGDKSGFFSRFTPGVRAFLSLLAGILRMPVLRFYVANVLSALAWSPSHILPGVLVGASFGLLGTAAKPIAVLLALLVVMFWVIIHAMRFAVRRGIPFLAIAAERLRAWASTRGDTRWSHALLSLLDPSRNEARILAALAILLVGAA